MAQKSGFFNALVNAGVYDRTYNADDYCDNLAVIISNGVLRGNDNLKVSASNLNLTVNAGRAWINGHYFYNDSTYSLPAVTAPTGGKRIDRVILRLDKTLSIRSLTIQYLQGTAATSPVAPALTRNENVYELCLAELTINANASTFASVVDTRSDADLCGWVYSVSGDDSFFENLDEEFETWFEEKKDTLASVTLFKRYKWESTLDSASSTVSFNIPQYDADTCFVEVYVNGFLADDYSVSGSTITFGTQLIAGTEVTVLAYKSIDGTGIMSVSDEITQLQNAYAALSGVSNYTYTCNGLNDNV